MELDQLLTFNPSNPHEEMCVTITTLSDDVYEGTEAIGIVLTSDDGVTVRPDEAILEITDLNRKRKREKEREKELH